MTTKKVCKNCRLFVKESVCPICKENKFTTNWKGRVAILNTESEIAKKLKITVPGEYAIKVG